MNERAMDPAKRGVEPLQELARLAWEWAPARCLPEQGCLDYHRSWGLVRLLLGNGRLPAGEAFFQQELAKVTGEGRRRILISGGADAGLLTLVLQACRGAGVEPDIVFADQCPTACELNSRMAAAAQADIRVVQGDICDLDIAPVDAVVAHSFLPFFEGEKRQAVLQAWSRNCTAGATVLISNVLKASESDWRTKKDEQAILERSQRFLQRAIEAGYPPALAQEMAQSALRFWKVAPARPPGLTQDNLRAGLERAGFEGITIRYSDAGVNDGPMAMGRPRLDGKARAEISATKSRH